MYDGSFDDIMLVPERLDDSLPNRSRVSLHSFVAIRTYVNYSDERMRLTRDLLGTESSSLSGRSMISSNEPSYMVLSFTAHCFVCVLCV